MPQLLDGIEQQKELQTSNLSLTEGQILHVGYASDGRHLTRLIYL
jgi:hypothetical protein